MVGRVGEGSGLENHHTERYQGFKSSTIRHISIFGGCIEGESAIPCAPLCRGYDGLVVWRGCLDDTGGSKESIRSGVSP